MAATQNANPFSGGGYDSMPDAYKYPNPFCDIASFYTPNNLSDAFEYMEFLFLTMPPFMAVTNRVVSYFLTDIEVNDVSDDVRDKYEDIFDDKLHMIQRLQDIGKDYFCFGGDTKVVTHEGSVPIRDLAGRTVQVLSIDGKWHPARFRSYGVQPTVEIEFGTGVRVRATKEHEWWVSRRYGSELSKVTTGEIRKSHLVPYQQPPRPRQGNNYVRGALHGIVFGLNKPVLAGHELEFLENFEEQSGLKADKSMRKIPDPKEKAEFWYGFFSGIAAVCGYFQGSSRQFFITNRSEKALKALKAGAAKAHIRTRAVVKRRIFNDNLRYYLPINLADLQEDDFLCGDQKESFVKFKTQPHRKYTTIRSIGTEWKEEEVFCCVEPDTHTFTLDGGVVTGNCYGNSFVSLYLPFERYLCCPKCFTQYKIDNLKYEFDSNNGEFKAYCPKCKDKMVMKRVDRRLHDPSKVQVIRWNPKRIKLKVHDISGQVKYYYKLDPKFVDHIRKGDPFYLNTTQWGFVETCLGKKSGSEGEHLFEFEDDQIFHLRDTVFAGLSDKIKGWAIPPLLPYFKLAYYIQLMRRYDEAIALDFIVPFRILYPQGQAPGGQDPLTMVSMQTFVAAMSSMVEKKRKNMTSIEVSPFAIGYEMIGGEAQQLSPKDNIQNAEQELLNAMGFPQELFAGTLSLQAAPVALRLFEREWNPFVDGMNSVLQWMTDAIAKYFMWDQAKVRLTPITLADDMEKKGIMLQMAAGQQLSNQTAFRALGYDYLKEQERIIQEQQDVQKLQQKAMAEAQAEQANGAMGGSGEGGADDSGMNGPGGSVGATPGSIEEQASQIAQNLVMANNPTQSRQTLASVEQTNPTLYAMVKAKMQEMRQQLSSDGKQMMIQQMQQQGG
jgi:hypothetical protein